MRCMDCGCCCAGENDVCIASSYHRESKKKKTQSVCVCVCVSKIFFFFLRATKAEAMECIVCYAETGDFLRPCGHSMCQTCALKWFTKKLVCPYCNATPYAHVVDNPAASPLDGVDVQVTGAQNGVVLTSLHGRVTVSKTEPGKSFHAANVVQGDVITHINNIRVVHHTDATCILDACKANNIPRCLTVVSARRKRGVCARAWQSFINLCFHKNAKV